MKHLFLAAALTLVAVPAFAQDWRPAGNPNNPANTGGVESAMDVTADRHADAWRDHDRYAYDSYGHDGRDFWRDRATPDELAMRDRDDAERAWDGLPHYY